jgi:hypothetical protein
MAANSLRWLWFIAFFVIGWVSMLPLAMSLLDSMTLLPVTDRFRSPFPILIVTGPQARVDIVTDPFNVPALPDDSSYLVPLESVRRIER